PFDKNRILYHFGDDATGEKYLRIQNLQTGEVTNIINAENIVYRPSWSVNDWILFSNVSGDIFKIKSTGDSLQKLLGNGYFYPAWSPKGDKFIVNGRSGTLLVSEKGEILDTLPIGGYVWHPVENNIIAARFSSAENQGIVQYNISDHSKRVIVKPIDIIGINRSSGLIWADAQNIIWFAQDYGIFKTNVLTGSTNKIRTICKYKPYNSFTMFPGDQFFYADRRDYKYVNDTPFIESNILRISIDGKHVTKIDVK
ncbi:MAG: TolB family protein, partial [Bacteroidia bacterium]